MKPEIIRTEAFPFRGGFQAIEKIAFWFAPRGGNRSSQFLFAFGLCAFREADQSRSLYAFGAQLNCGLWLTGRLPEPGRFATVLDNAVNKKLLSRALGEDALGELQNAAKGGLRNKTVWRVAAGAAGFASADVVRPSSFI